MIETIIFKTISLIMSTLRFNSLVRMIISNIKYKDMINVTSDIALNSTSKSPIFFIVEQVL
ncbi:MAG: hypothetical protein IPH62_00175 [Ignavibacteriae bacterium]|nr:hypothetical protein [Ignavibacteriota bacterium]